jgi:hypothetical protein
VPQVNTLDASPTPNTHSSRLGSWLRHLPMAVAVLGAGGLLATAAIDRGADITAAPPPVPTSSAAPGVATVGDVSVPDASTVFSGREVEIEEPAPTF